MTGVLFKGGDLDIETGTHKGRKIFSSHHFSRILPRRHLWPSWPSFLQSFLPSRQGMGNSGILLLFKKKKNYLFFNWRIIALQNFVVFYQTSRWISHRSSACGAYIPSALQQDVHLADHFLWTLKSTHHWLPHWLSWIQTFPSPRKQKSLILTYCTQSFQGVGFDILKA